MDEFPVEVRIERLIDQMVHNTVASRGLVDIPRFRIAYVEWLIITMRICPILQIMIKRN